MQAFSSRINIPLLHEPRNDTETVGFPCKTYRFYCAPGERTFCRVKVPKSPGSGKI